MLQLAAIQKTSYYYRNNVRTVKLNTELTLAQQSNMMLIPISKKVHVTIAVNFIC